MSFGLESFFEGMEVEASINMPEYGDIQLNLSETEDVVLRMSIPRGIEERNENNNLNDSDKRWLAKCILTATGLEADDLDSISQAKLNYLASCVVRMLARKKVESYYNFVQKQSPEEEQSLIEQGSWQVRE